MGSMSQNAADELWSLEAALFLPQRGFAEALHRRNRDQERSLKLEVRSKGEKTKHTYGVGSEATQVTSVKSDHHLFPEAPLIILDAISLKQILFHFIVPDQAMQFLLAGHFLAFIRLSQ